MEGQKLSIDYIVHIFISKFNGFLNIIENVLQVLLDLQNKFKFPYS